MGIIFLLLTWLNCQAKVTRINPTLNGFDMLNPDSFKEIRIYADNGPVHTSDGHMVEFNWYNHKNEYEEDIFTLLNLNKLTHVHAYVMASFRKWSPHFAQEVLAQTSIRRGRKYFEIFDVASGDGLRYVPNCRDTLKLYHCKLINVGRSVRKEKIKYKNETAYNFGNYESEQTSVITRGKAGKMRGKKTVVYLLKESLKDSWLSGWEVSLFNSKQDLKSSKEGTIYKHSFKDYNYCIVRAMNE